MRYQIVKTKYFIYLFLIGIMMLNLKNIQAQSNPLTLERAVELAFLKNYDIQIAKSEAEIAKLNNYSGNAGMLPRFGSTLSNNYQSIDINQKLSNGNESSRKGASSNTTNAFVGLNYTFFDGGKMFITKKKLDLLQSSADFNLQIALQNLKAMVSQQYFICINQIENIESYNKTLVYAQERLNLSKLRLESGLSSKTDYLQAQIDFTSIITLLDNFKAQKELSLITLKNLINISQDSLIDLSTVDYPFDVNKYLTTKDVKNNPIIKNNEINVLIAKKVTEEFKTYYYPNANTQIGYNYSLSQASAGLILVNQQKGPTFQLGLNIPIFNGGITNHNIKVAQVQEKKSEINLLKNERILLDNLYKSQTLLKFYLSELENEKSIVKFSKDNLDLINARFKQGISTSLEIRDAEKTYQNALQKCNDTKLLLIQSEIAIQQSLGF